MWYKETIIYELHVRSFADGDGDGVGDFKGLTSRLDYLERLGVGALWLLPFYPSPLRDDGYDIADYTSVHPDYGTLASFRRFLREAHARGMRVITELVLNHTSDLHPWFQRARHAKPGSAARDFYVWSDTPDKYRGARIIFKDFEHSNWTWDPVAKAYYWHRFYSHQPDLNFDNPAVRKAMLKVVDHWFSMGVDGLRLDAVPYLFERRGTNCENLPETHAFLKELRAHVDAKFPGRMLLAEANQWPEDAVHYFGDGDECHMAFHFPVMPRIFMALQMEDRHPVADILEQTPPIPENAQWAMFLRNHDELTLEMVSDEERDYMYRAYARDSKARINLGIRRRLAPLMQNNRRRMEVINFLLFSFPGTPIIYYGDELGMGDNYHLGDRNGVRTPMQWSPDRNAGFSRANPQSLFLPVVIDPEYHYEVVNVETQERNPTSLLWWMRRLVATYKSQPALGKGRLEFVRVENTRVLAFLRIHEDETVLVLVNLSRFAQAARLDLSAQAGSVPVDVFGGSRFPAVTQAPYVVTLGPHDHFWLRLEQAASPGEALPGRTPVARVRGGKAGAREVMEAAMQDVCPHLMVQGWPGGVASLPPREVRILDRCVLGGDDSATELVLAEGLHGQDPPVTHLLLSEPVTGERLEELSSGEPGKVAVRVLGGPEPLGVVSGLAYAGSVARLVGFMAAGRKKRGLAGDFSGEAHAVRDLRALARLPHERYRLMRGTSRAVCWVLDDACLVKVYRRPEEGRSQDLELLQALARARFPGIPRLLGSLSYSGGPGSMTLALAREFVQGAQDGRAFTAQAMSSFFERVLASGEPAPDASRLGPHVPPELSPAQGELMGEYVLEFFRGLGRRTAELHRALAALPGQAFAPEPFTKLYLRASYQSMRNIAHKAGLAVRSCTGGLLPDGAELPLKAVLERFHALTRLAPSGQRIRIHGGFGLDTVLCRGRDILFCDFDGDTRLPLGERVIKRSPLRDVAGMTVSIFMEASRAMRRERERNPRDAQDMGEWLSLWRWSACHAFVGSYLEADGGSALLPAESEDADRLLELFLLEQLLRLLVREIDEAGQDAAMILDLVGSYMRVFPPEG